AVILKRRDPVGMAEHRCQIRSVGSEPGFRARPVAKIHSALLDGSNLHSCHTATASQQGRNQAAGSLGLRLSRINYGMSQPVEGAARCPGLRRADQARPNPVIVRIAWCAIASYARPLYTPPVGWATPAANSACLQHGTLRHHAVG